MPAHAGARISLTVTCCPDRGLGLEGGRRRSGRLQDRPVGRNRLTAPRPDRGDRGPEVDRGGGGGEGLQDDFGRARHDGRDGAVRRRQQGDLVTAGHLVDAGHRPSLALPLPRADERDPVDVQCAGLVDPDRRAKRQRRVLERTALDQDPGGEARGPGLVVAVDADNGGLARERGLDLRQPCPTAGERAARRHRRERVEAARVARRRSGDDADRDGTMERELDALLERHAGHQRDRRRGSCGRSRERAGDRGQEQVDGA